MALGNRANNPGNVSLPIKGWTGGGSIIGAPGQPGYAQFPSFQTGVAAWSQRLDTYAMRPGGNTIRGLNDTIGYATDPNWKNNVAAGSGLGLDTPLDASNRGALMVGIAKAEGNYGSMTQEQRDLLAGGGSSYSPPYDNFSPSGLDTSSLSAPGSFSTEGEPWQGSTFPDDNSLKVTVKPEGTYEGIDNGQGDSGLTGDNVSSPKSGSKGSTKDVPTAIVTSGDQQAKVTANAAKTTAEAALKAANTTSEAQKAQTANETKLQSEQQGWASNWAVRIFLFIVGAIFLAGGLFLFGGQAVFQSKSA